MQTNQEIFMLVAEEMSISRAAERAFVSQQCVSDHIKRMEQQYGVRLFTRKPRFQLTEAGAAMLQSLQKIQAIEKNMQENLHKHASGVKGSFTMGISASRAQVFLPWVLPEYHALYPDVEIKFFMDDTVILEQNLRKGNLDLFFGVNAKYSEDLGFLHLCQDEMRFVISEDLLQRTFGARADQILASDIDLNDFTRVPFIKMLSTSAMSSVFQDYLDEHHVTLHSPYKISDTATQIALCAKGLGAGIGPQMLLAPIKTYNKNCPPGEYIHVLPLKNFRKALRIDLVSLGCVEKPLYLRAFEELSLKAIRKNYAEQ